MLRAGSNHEGKGNFMERRTGLEPATVSGRRCSTGELPPQMAKRKNGRGGGFEPATRSPKQLRYQAALPEPREKYR